MFDVIQYSILTALFHRQERNLAIEHWASRLLLYGTVYQQQFVKLTDCIYLSSSSKQKSVYFMI